MAMNFNRCNSFSSLANETIDFRLFLSSSTHSNTGLNVIRDGSNGLLKIGSNFGHPAGLVSHTVIEVRRSFVSPQRSVQMVHSFIDHASMPNLLPSAFPLTDVAVTHEVVKTTRFLTSTSTMDRMFGSSCHSVRNQLIFPTNGVFALAPQPSVRNQPNYQVLNPFLSQNSSRNVEAFNVFNHANLCGKVKMETDFDLQGLISHHMPANNLQNPNQNLNDFNYDMNFQDRAHDPQSDSFEEVHDENDYDYPLGYDGRTHSLPNYPDRKYGCPRCFAVFDSPQLFASHIKTHYLQETDEERKRRMAAKCRTKNLRLVHSSYGLTAVPDLSFKRRKNGKRQNDAVIENLGEVINLELDLKTPQVAAKKGPLHGVMIKVEPM